MVSNTPKLTTRASLGKLFYCRVNLPPFFQIFCQLRAFTVTGLCLSEHANIYLSLTGMATSTSNMSVSHSVSFLGAAIWYLRWSAQEEPRLNTRVVTAHTIVPGVVVIINPWASTLRFPSKYLLMILKDLQSKVRSLSQHPTISNRPYSHKDFLKNRQVKQTANAKF